MKLLQNEQKLITSNGDKIILTDHRIMMDDKNWGESFSITIFLEDISSIELKYKSYILFILLAVLSVLGGFLMADQMGAGIPQIGIAGGVIFLALWWFTRQHIVSISSNGGSSLNFSVKGLGEEKIAHLLDNLALAKQTRVNQLHKV